MPESRDVLSLDQETKQHWRDYLTDFEKNVYPLFRVKGYSHQDALLVWGLNRIFNILDDINDRLPGDE